MSTLLKGQYNELALSALLLSQYGGGHFDTVYAQDGVTVAGYEFPDDRVLALDSKGVPVGYDDALTQATKPPVPEVISDRQFAQALADTNVITQDEALSFVRTGTLPAALQAAVDSLPDASAKFAAEMLISGATTFERNHPMVSVLGKALKKSDADLDALWIQGASL